MVNMGYRNMVQLSVKVIMLMVRRMVCGNTGTTMINTHLNPSGIVSIANNMVLGSHGMTTNNIPKVY